MYIDLNIYHLLVYYLGYDEELPFFLVVTSLLMYSKTTMIAITPNAIMMTSIIMYSEMSAFNTLAEVRLSSPPTQLAIQSEMSRGSHLAKL